MKLVRTDFKEEGPHQWVANYKGTAPDAEEWRFLVRQIDGQLEIIIRAAINRDPTDDDWERALETLNVFIQRERLGQIRQGPRPDDIK